MSGAELAIGTRIGRYETTRAIGRGAFGVVFAARDTELDREVALKVLMPQHTLEPQLMQRFFHEAKAAAKIEHPSIVTVYEFGKVAGTSTMFDGSAYIAMEMVRGESLASRLRRAGKLAAGTVIELGRQIASAIGAAHRAGIIHRDLKPDNLMLARDPVAPLGERIKVLDFGIAKLGEATKSQSMQTMGAFGTPLYMAPEQFRAAGEVDARADIYALGCILTELATGRPPFDGRDMIELFAQHSTARRVNLTELPEAVAQLVTMMLAPEPQQRPASMRDVELVLAQDASVIAPFGVAATQQVGTTSVPHAMIATTLGSAAGASLGAVEIAPPSRQRRSRISIAACIAVAVAVAFVATRGRGDDQTIERPPPAQPMRSPSPPKTPSGASLRGSAITGDTSAPIVAPAAPVASMPTPVVAPAHSSTIGAKLSPAPHGRALVQGRAVPVAEGAVPASIGVIVGPAVVGATAAAPLPPEHPVIPAPDAGVPHAPRNCPTNDPVCAFGGP